MSTALVKTSPESWLEDIRAAITNPKTLQYASGVVPGSNVIPVELSDAFNTFHIRAISHATTRGEHEALMYLSFYVIHHYKLFVAHGEGTWEGYCDEVDASPIGVSKSSIKSKVKDVQDLLDRGVSVDNIVRLLAIAPMAARSLPDIPKDKLPSGGIEEVAENAISLGPDEATRYLADLSGEPTLKCIEHRYDKNTKKLLLKVRTNDRVAGETYDDDYVIKDIEELQAKWLVARLGRRRI